MKLFNTDRVLIWRLILKEYGPDIQYIQVSKNIAADTLSRFTKMKLKRLYKSLQKRDFFQKPMTPKNYLNMFPL